MNGIFKKWQELFAETWQHNCQIIENEAKWSIITFYQLSLLFGLQAR
jgi:hypothetical protein